MEMGIGGTGRSPMLYSNILSVWCEVQWPKLVHNWQQNTVLADTVSSQIRFQGLQILRYDRIVII